MKIINIMSRNKKSLPSPNFCSCFGLCGSSSFDVPCALNIDVSVVCLLPMQGKLQEGTDWTLLSVVFLPCPHPLVWHWTPISSPGRFFFFLMKEGGRLLHGDRVARALRVAGWQDGGEILPQLKD